MASGECFRANGYLIFQIFRTYSEVPLTETPASKPNRRWANCRIIIPSVLGLIVGILIGRFAACSSYVPEPTGLYLPGVPKTLMRDEDRSVIDELMNSIDSENIRNNLK